MNFPKGRLKSQLPYGLGSLMRMRRHAFFLSLLHSLPVPLTILDIGGTERYWRFLGFTASEHIRITLFNLNKQSVSSPYLTSVVGNATDMKELGDRSYDIVFSNSVIEHVGDFNAQKRMAREVMRVGKRFFIQTPNYWFPLEPHFLFPGFQWLPIDVRVWMIQHFNLGWQHKTPDPAQARRLITRINLLRKRQLLSLFPDTHIFEEKILFLTKSFIVYAGWE